ncbi:2987_t:CDS:2 [Ambispora gerdemannii]|uniref:2987_t:CDS:1 n=1 Tax=Ambispora gerdemannii TaxID=144530 RepID=A0A9N8Z2W4_9GLOM|nr:2987_t:CDS:2 [Ambispora gerdemannii]
MARLQLEREHVRREALHEAELKQMETGLDMAESKLDLLSGLKQKGESLLKEKINQVTDKGVSNQLHLVPPSLWEVKIPPDKLAQLGIKETENETSLINSLLDTISQQATEIEVNQKQLLNYQVQPVASFSDRPTPRTPRSLNTPAISELDELVEIVHQQEVDLESNATQIITELQTQAESLRQQLQDLTTQLTRKENDLIRGENQRQTQLNETVKLQEKVKKLKTELESRENDLVSAETELAQITEDFDQAEEEKEKVKKYYLEALLKERNAKLELEKQLAYEGERAELQRLIDEQETKYQEEKTEREVAFRKQMDNMRLFQLTAIREVNQPAISRHKYNASLPTSLSNSPRHSVCYVDGEENFKSQVNSPSGESGANPFEQIEERRSSTSSMVTNHENLDKVFGEVLETLTDLETETSNSCNADEHKKLVAELKDWEDELGQVKYELQEAQARERSMKQELQSKEEQIILFTEQLKNFQVESEVERQGKARQMLLLQTQNENLQNELEAVKNERAAQKSAFTNLASNVKVLEETNQQLKKAMERLKKTNKQSRKSDLKELRNLLQQPSQLIKETMADEEEIDLEEEDEASESEAEANENEDELSDLKEKIADYGSSIATLLAAVKELNTQKQAAEKKRDELQKRVSKLEKKGTDQQARVKGKIAEVKEVSEQLEAQIELDLERYEQDLKKIGEGIKQLKAGNRQAIQAKDQEIQNLKDKLLACQQKRANIQQWENKEEKNEIGERLMTALIGCASQKDKIIEYLAQPCSSCECKSKTTKDLTTVRN